MIVTIPRELGEIVAAITDRDCTIQVFKITEASVIVTENGTFTRYLLDNLGYPARPSGHWHEDHNVYSTMETAVRNLAIWGYCTIGMVNGKMEWSSTVKGSTNNPLGWATPDKEWKHD